MASHPDSSPELISPEETLVPLKRAPTLYAIIFFKLAKGILFFFFGLVLYFQAARNLPQEYADLLKKPIFQNLRIHPENKFVQHIADQIADLTEQRIRWAALGTMAWSLFPSVEGIGLLFRWGWAGWTAIAETAFFIPIEFYEMAREYSFYLLLATVANILIVWYLFANRDRLFRHHHHPH
ncbi:MAG TPA: DUF2127 domain-containing protein [Verrucomicrobiae bacterium]|jgi:uncharacterized membrane protein (DUF2068 family)|nr:DUF2127 domain-containing protein [Verrucomicrobiae bacterium]